MANGKKKISLRERVQEELNEFNESPESIGFELRLNLMSMLCELLDEKKMTQKQLAELAEMQESFVSRVINADSNCTFDVAGRLLFALGIRSHEIVLQRNKLNHTGDPHGEEGSDKVKTHDKQQVTRKSASKWPKSKPRSITQI